jgi:tetratricopeptide (TPR) repeat protein
MHLQNKKTIKWTLLWSVMALCLLPTGCRDKSTEYYNRGWRYLDKEQYDLAISEFNFAIRIKPKLFKAYYGRGIAYRNKSHQGFHQGH